MKIGIIGLGAMGKYLACMLGQHNIHDITLIVKPSRENTIRINGLELLNEDGTRLNVLPSSYTITTDYGVVSDVDVIFICTKAYDTKDIIQSIHQHISPNTIIATVQNGIEGHELVASVFTNNPTLGVICYVSAESDQEFFRVNFNGHNSVCVGSLRENNESSVMLIQNLLRDSGINLRETENFEKTLWYKLMWNVPFNSLNVITKLTAKEFINIPCMRELIVSLMEEVIRIAASKRIIMVRGVVDDFINKTAEANRKYSMLQDYLNDKPMEIDLMLKYPLNIAKNAGIRVPYIETVYALVVALDQQRRRK